MKKLKRIIPMILVLVMAMSSSVIVNAIDISSSSTASSSVSLSDEQYIKQKEAEFTASDNNNISFADIASDERYVKAKEAELNKRLGLPVDYFEKYREWIEDSQKMGYFHDDGNGHIIADSVAEKLAPAGLGENYLLGIRDLNELIDMGIYSFNEKTGLQSHALECIKNPLIMKSVPEDLDKISPNAMIFELGTEVHNNYQAVEMRYLSGGGGGYAVALAFWLKNVTEYGEWDYKRLPGFVNKTFTCYYGPGNSRTGLCSSEWIGNYNYGYTGRFLFTLDILHQGSAAVGGGVEKDKHDWPAIDAGYNDSGIIE